VTSPEPLPAPSRALWITVVLLALFPITGAIAYVTTPPGEHGAALFIALVPVPILLIYVLSLRSIRILDRRTRAAHPDGLVFPVAMTAEIRAVVDLLPGAAAPHLVQYAGVSVDTDGVMLWMNGRPAPVAVLRWADVTSVDVGGSPVDVAQGNVYVKAVRSAGWESLGRLRVAAIQISGRYRGTPFTLPLTLYSPRTGYPVSRAEFAIVASSLLALKASGDPPAPSRS
jgi:hypothetical protein